MSDTIDSEREIGRGAARDTAGTRLRTAREAAGLSIDAVAQQLKLAPRQVQALEDDDWERLPGRRIPSEPIPDLAPDLAVEVLSPGNTPGEMARKRQEYFAAGVRLVWLVDPEARTVEVYTDPEQSTVRHEADTLEGGAVLPGFALPLRELFAELEHQ